jgi:hypothetical protein
VILVGDHGFRSNRDLRRKKFVNLPRFVGESNSATTHSRKPQIEGKEEKASHQQRAPLRTVENVHSGAEPCQGLLSYWRRRRQ